MSVVRSEPDFSIVGVVEASGAAVDGSSRATFFVKRSSTQLVSSTKSRKIGDNQPCRDVHRLDLGSDPECHAAQKVENCRTASKYARRVFLLRMCELKKSRSRLRASGRAVKREGREVREQSSSVDDHALSLSPRDGYPNSGSS